MNDIEYAEAMEWLRNEYPGYFGNVWILDIENANVSNVAYAARLRLNLSVGEFLSSEFDTLTPEQHSNLHEHGMYHITLEVNDLVITPRLIELLDRDEFIGIMIHEIAHAAIDASEVQADIVAVLEGYGPALASALEKMFNEDEQLIRSVLGDDPDMPDYIDQLWNDYEPEYCSSPLNRIQCLRDGTFLD